MKKMCYFLFLFIFSSSFLTVSAQHKISIRTGVYCTGVGLVSLPYTDITEGNIFTVSDWTLPASFASVQNIYNSLRGSTFLLEEGALSEDIQIDWVLYNISCTNGQYLPSGTLNQTVFNSYFTVYHMDGGSWVPLDSYVFNNGKKAILSLKNTPEFQTLLTGITGGVSHLGFAYYASTNHSFNLSGLTLTPPASLTDPNDFWVLSAAHFSNIVGGNQNQIAGINDMISSVPSAFGLKQNYPNPFNPSTFIEYSLPEKSYVELNVYNILGVKVASLVKSPKEAGIFKVEFNGSELSSGLYIYELKTNKATISRKMLLLK